MNRTSQRIPFSLAFESRYHRVPKPREHVPSAPPLPPSPSSPPRSGRRVWLSYSHDSEQHPARVLALSDRLRLGGIDAELDQYLHGPPPEGWPRWMLDRLDWAEAVLVVCTETYYRRFRGHEEPGKGQGADWECALITQELYKRKSVNTKFIPILLNPADEKYIPEPLGATTPFTLTSEDAYQALYDVLLDQSGYEKPPLGKPAVKSRPHGEPAKFGPTDDNIERPVSSATRCQISPQRLPRTSAKTLVGRDAELTKLHQAWQAALDQTTPRAHVISVRAWGGVGKTALVAHWLDELAAKDWAGAERVFEWSFYSQGTRERGGTSADSFIKEALDFFGDAETAASAKSAWDKGARLAALVAESKSLLVLDGLEPLQYPPGPQAGELQDPALKALLTGLARNVTQGLCVLTTRESVADLGRYGQTAHECELDHLSDPAGAQLLENLGVRGTGPEREQASRDVQGHALTLELIGSYLARAHGGDIRKRDLVKLEAADAEVQGGHAFKVMAAYESWFASGGRRGARQLALLRLMGFFDRPADPGCLRALRQPPAIAGLTEPLVELSNADWNLVVSDLVEAGLVKTSAYEPTPIFGYSEEQVKKPLHERGRPTRFEGPDQLGLENAAVLDVHPLVREYFGKQVREQTPDAFREGHRRIYEHLKRSVPYWPEGLEGLQPLFQSVADGCQAGLHEDALANVYRDRIDRGGEFYSSDKLGAYGADSWSRGVVLRGTVEAAGFIADRG